MGGEGVERDVSSRVQVHVRWVGGLVVYKHSIIQAAGKLAAAAAAAARLLSYLLD